MIIRLILLLVIGVLFSTVDGFGQNTWLKTYGGSNHDDGQCIITTLDGGIVVAGNTTSKDKDFEGMDKGQTDIFLLKIDSNNNLVWKRSFGGWLNDSSSAVIESSEGDGYIIIGSTSSNDGDFGGMNHGSQDIFVYKTDYSGNIVWKKLIGGSGSDICKSITKSEDGGYFITGYTESNDFDFDGLRKGGILYDIYVAKLNKEGIVTWIKTFGGTDHEEGQSVISTKDGCIFSGKTHSRDGDFKELLKGWSDIFIVKLDLTGNILWKKTFGGGDQDESYRIIKKNENSFTLTGLTWSNNFDFNVMNKGGCDIVVIHLDSIGNLIWKKTYGGTGIDVGFSMTNSDNGGYIITGFEMSRDGDFKGVSTGTSNIFLIKLNEDGDLIYKKTYGGTSENVGTSITSKKNSIFLTGWTTSNDLDFLGLNKGKKDCFLMKLDSNGNLNNTTSINEFNETTTILSIHPNPFSNSSTISYKVETPSNVRIELLNTLGQTIEVLREDYTDIGIYQLPLNISTLSSGMYSLRMISGSMNEVVPVCVVR